MVHNPKKRAASESEAVVKVKEEFVSKKKKSANGAVQNGQANKEVKKEVSAQVKVEQKPGGEKDGKSRVAYREKRKQARAGKQVRGVKPDTSVEDIKKKVEEIENRGNLSKTAKRKLASLKKLLHIKQGTYKPKPQVVKKQAGEGKKEKQVAAANKKQVQNTVEQKKKVPEKVEAKSSKDGKKKDVKQGNLLLVKQTKQSDDEDDDEDDEEEDTDVDNVSGEDEDGSDVEEEEGDDDEDEDDDDDDDEDEEEEDDDDDDDDEEDEAEEVKKKVPQSPSKQTAEQGGKKKRYVLFVGNLPFTATMEDVKKHFLTKVSEVVDVRLPKTKDNAPRGFAYVELSNQVDYEKAISLHNSQLSGRKINVQYSGSNKKETVAKNQKLQALQKAGKLGGGQKPNFRKNAGWKGGKPHAQKTKT